MNEQQRSEKETLSYIKISLKEAEQRLYYCFLTVLIFSKTPINPDQKQTSTKNPMNYLPTKMIII